jgi:hypothetical protein
MGPGPSPLQQYIASSIQVNAVKRSPSGDFQMLGQFYPQKKRKNSRKTDPKRSGISKTPSAPIP